MKAAAACAAVLACSLLAQGCARLQPAPMADSTRPMVERQRLAEAFQVSDTRPAKKWWGYIPSLWLLSEMDPHLKVQQQDLGPWAALQLAGYYRQAGAGEAAGLASSANTRFLAGQTCTLAGLGMLAKAVADSYHEVPPWQNAWTLGGAAAGALGLWLRYDSVAHYLRPGARSYNAFLKGRLGLALAPTGQGMRVASRWEY